MIVGTAEIDVLANTSGFEDEMRAGTAGGMSNVEDDAEKAGKNAGGKLSTAMNTAISGHPLTALKGLASDLGPVGGAVAGVGIAAATATGFVIDLGSKMDDATAKIAAGAGISVEQAKKMGAAFDTTGGQFTVTGTQMASAYAGVAAQLGATQGHALSANQALMVMKASADLAEASGVSLDSATQNLSKTLQTFQLPMSDAASVTDTLYNVSKTTGTGIDSVTGSLTKLKSGLGSNAPDIRTMGGLIEDLANHGESGRKSITALTSGITALASPTAKVQEAAYLMGITLQDANGHFVGMQSVMDQLKPKMVGMTADQQKNYEANLLGTKGAAQWQATIAAGGGVLDKYESSASKAGSTSEAAQKTTETFGGSMAKLKSAALDIGTTIGTKLTPIIDKLAKDLAQAATWINEHWPQISAVIGGVFKVVGPIISGFIEEIKGLVLILSGVVEFVSDVFHGKWGAAWRAIQQIFDGFVDTIKGRVQMILAPFEMIKPGLDKIWHDVLTGIETAWANIVSFFQAIPGRLLAALGDVVTFLFSPWIKATSWIDSNVLVPLVNWFQQVPQRLLTALGDVVTFLFTPWIRAGTWIDQNVLVPVVGFFSGLPGRLLAGLGDMVSFLFAPLAGAWTWIKTNAYDPIVNGFKGLPGDIGNAISSAASAVGSFFSSLIQDLVNVLNQAIDWINNHIPKIPIINTPIFPSLPHISAAQGAFVTQPTIALVGEAGPEYIIPASSLASSSGTGLPTGAGAGVGGVQVTVAAGAVVINPPVGTSPASMAAAINEGFTALSREVLAGVAPMRVGSAT